MYGGPVIDCDVHYVPERPTDISGYLASEWRERLALTPGGLPTPGQSISVTEQPDGVSRLDAYPPDGKPAGSSLAMLREQLLDPFEVEVALLTQAAGPTTPNGELAHALCRATNDYLAERWLTGLGDERLYGAMFVPTRDPLQAAAEIRRSGQNERFAAAHLTYAFGQLYGQSVYDPIYEAAVELDLPLYIHGSSGEIMGGSAPPQSGGAVLHYRLEMFATLHHPVASHLTSMIVHGVFERFPTLRLVVAELGVAWLPWFVASLDANAELMRRESSWVRRTPSDYLREHVAFSTQPIEATVSERDRLVDQLASVEGIERMLCFSSDYPHWDGDEPTFIASILPAEWHAQVFYENGRRLLRLPASVPSSAPLALSAG